MDNLRIVYKVNKNRLVDLNYEIDELEKDAKVEKYKELIELREVLRKHNEMLYGNIKLQEYNECNHVLVTTSVENSIDYECRSRAYYGCIKCGLDESAVKGCYLSGDLEAMKIYFRERTRKYPLNNSIPGIRLGGCDLSLARSIYSRIKQKHPDIDDATAIKYFEKALGDIRNIEVNDERKESRAKRLNLCKNFKNWNADSVYHY